ncbi:MFS transporter [Streptomyces sp. KLOTTS4A1]|uniref:MFS transporter n=1 Tax=Streptomyces sp. KLOTTS4A1 TaxID=3390996 RepID=UPI0039F610DF
MDQLISADPTSIGPYRLIARLGAGGMGLVYLGRSAGGRTVAVKVVQEEHAAHPEFRRRFAREVAAARRVGGAWTADVLDSDTEADVPWVATQYIPGPDLTSVAKDFGPLPEHSVRVLAHRLAEALTAVHGAGLIHRDLKPSNVLVTVDGPRVIDFGIARAMDGLAPDSLLTHTGMLVGSPGFMSPEQVRGLELTPASDVFCLGAVLVYAATGRMLFGAGSSGLNAHLFRIAEEEPDLAGVPDALLGLVTECLRKDPTQRPTPEQIVERTAADGGSGGEDEWLPGPVLAQLGRHAARLLDFGPETRMADGQGPPEPAASPAAASAASPAAAANPAVNPAADPRTPFQREPSGADRAASPLQQPGHPPQGVAPAPGHPQAAVPAQGFGPPPLPAGPPPGPYDATTPLSPKPHPRRRMTLAWAVLAQLLVLLGPALVRTVLPEITRDLDTGSDTWDWMLLAYSTGFGGLLLLGGQLADRVGRKPLLIAGLAGTALSGVLLAAAPGAPVLIAAQALAGVSAALTAVSALALVSAHFPTGRGRAGAFGVYAAVTGGGAALGQLLAGLLGEGLAWRGAWYGFAGLALLVLFGTALGAHDVKVSAATPVARFDLPGVVLGGTVPAAFAWVTLKKYEVGLTSPAALIPLAVGLALLLAFAWSQQRAGAGLLPRGFLREPDRLGALFALLLVGAVLSCLIPAVNIDAQYALGYPLLRAGAALLPLVAALAVAAVLVAARVLPRSEPRALIATGLLLAALGLLLLSTFGPEGSYAVGLLPGLLLCGFGLGLALAPLFAAATAVSPSPLAPRQYASVAAGVLFVYQIGLGLGGELLWRNLEGGGFVAGEELNTALTDANGSTLLRSAGVMVLAAAAGAVVRARGKATEPALRG